MLFADVTTFEAAVTGCIGAVLAMVGKFILDVAGVRFGQRQTEFEKVIEQTRLDFERMERKCDEQDAKIEDAVRKHTDCEIQRAIDKGEYKRIRERDLARIDHLMNELERNGIKIAPYNPEGSGHHRPLESHEDEGPS